MKTVADVTQRMETLAPLEYAEEWDRVGLLIGSTSWPARHIMLTIDLTETVLQEAIDRSADMIIAYHPPIFRPLDRLTDATAKERIALEAARASISVYSPHTALDAAPGGVNDWLASALGSGDARALRAHESLPASQQCKIVTFCPQDAVDPLRSGLAAIGAGTIGEYQQCSFEINGHGTFHGSASTQPSVGESEKLERVAETRLEMVCSNSSLALAVVTLRQFHPYEEPPIEIYPLKPRPLRSVGGGRRVTLDQRADLPTLAKRIKAVLGVGHIRVAHGAGAPSEYDTIGLCAGAGGELLASAVSQGCQMFLTGEMRHHDVLAAQADGCTVVLAGHTNTERGYLEILRERVSELGEVEVWLSQRDADPLELI